MSRNQIFITLILFFLTIGTGYTQIREREDSGPPVRSTAPVGPVMVSVNVVKNT